MFNFMVRFERNYFKFNVIIYLIIMISQPACEMLGIQDRYPLLTAAQSGDLIGAEELLRKNADVNYVTEDQRFALLEASSVGNLEIVKLLVDNGADVNLSNKFGMTALMAAASDGNEEVVRFLINKGADLTLTNEKGFSALHFAINEDNKSLVELLVNHDAPINGSKSDGVSPLFLAVKNGENNIVRILIENGADLDGTNAGESTALHLAAKMANHELVILLIDQGADIFKKNNLGEDGFLIIGGADYNSIINNIYERIEKTMKELSDENTETEDSLPIYNLFAVFQGLESINPEHSSKASMKQFFDALENSQLSIDITNEKFDSIVEQLKADYLLIMKAFLDKGADVNMTDKKYQSAIMRICNQNTGISTKFKDKSISLEPDVEKRFNKAFKTAENIHGELIQLLVDAGADVNLKDKNGQTALMAACENGHSKYAEFLIENGAEINQSNNAGWSPLIYAVSAEDFYSAELLLSSGANVNATNAFNETALLKAVHRNNAPLVGLLLKNGANIGIKNLHGDSPLSVAQKKKYMEIVKILKSY